MLQNIVIKDFVESRTNTVYTPVLNDEMQTAVNYLAKTFPDWVFEGNTESHSYQDERNEMTGAVERTYYVRKIDVNSSGQYLGSFQINQWYTAKYVINNERISMMRERGHGIKSSSIESIAKSMRKYFTDLTLPEKISKHFGRVEYAVDEVAREASSKVRQQRQSINAVLESVVRDNLEKSKGLLAQLGVPMDAMDKMPEIVHDYEIRHIFRNAFGNSKGVSFVMTENSNYYFVRREDKAHPIIRTTEDLSPKMKQNLGLLKLVEDGTFLEGIGMKHKDNLFVVYDDLPVKEKGDA